MAEINFHKETESLATTRTTKYTPVEGIINSAILHFPNGCNSLVEVFINHYSNQILPIPTTGGGTTNDGIALNDTTQSFGINELIKKNDPIEIVINNHDDTNDHTLSVIILIQETDTYTGP